MRRSGDPLASRVRAIVSAAPVAVGDPGQVCGRCLALLGGVSGGPITEAVLIGLGSMTHAFDANQRHVQLALAGPPTATGATVIGPPDRQTAPPGHYMLFVLNQSSTPSVARIVRLR